MKCPQCSTSQKRKEGMKCAKCGYAHVFDPKSDGVTDGKFMAMLRSASANDTYFFTFNQLYAVYCRGRSRLIDAVMLSELTTSGWLGVLVGLGGLGVLVAGIALDGALLAALGVISAIGGIVLFVTGRSRRELAPARRMPPGIEQLRGWVHKWEGAGHTIPKLLRAPSLDKPPAPYREPDIFDYGVERVIVVEHDLLVDLFVKNGLHTGQRALVISESGYPAYLVPHAQRLLAERADLPVILLHDATPAGTAMRERVERSGLLGPPGRRITDAGLFPSQVGKIKSLDQTVPEARGGATPIDYLPFGAMAAGLAGLAVAGAMVPGLAHAEVPDAAARQRARAQSDTSGGDAASGADFESADFGGDADFG